MNFLQKLFGKSFSAEQKESLILDDKDRVARYREVEGSKELKEYLELDKLIMSDEFVQKKYNWQHKDFKMTKTYATASRYKELLNDEGLQIYLELEQSKRLKEYLKFKESKDYAKLQNEQALSQSEELQWWHRFENSDEYKTYLKYAASELPQEYKALLAEMDTKEFKQKYAFWSNPNRWKTTDEYQQYIRYKQLSKRPDIIFYLKQDPAEIARLEKELKKK